MSLIYSFFAYFFLLKKVRNPDFIWKFGVQLSKKKIKITGEEPLEFSQKMLVDIVGARVSEIFAIANKELRKISRQGVLPAGVVLTGGGAKLPGIKDLAKKELKLPCRIGISQISSSFQEDPSLSTLYGLILEGVNSEEGEEGNFPGFGKRTAEKLKKLLRVFKP